MKNIKSSKDLVNEFSKIIENTSKLSKTSSLYNQWSQIIGDENLSKTCELYNIKNNTISIKTNHTGWSQQVLMRKKSIIRNINRLYPDLKIKNITVFIENENTQDFISKKTKKHNLTDILTEKENKEINQFENEIKEIDPDLEKALKDLKKRILNKNKK